MKRSKIKLAMVLLLPFMLSVLPVIPAQADLQVSGVFTDTLRVMGKGADHIVVGEEPMYVIPKVSRLRNRHGSKIDLDRLLTPCLARIKYAKRAKGVEKLPVVLYLKVIKVYSGATPKASLEKGDDSS
jgi:hypothetical protein